MREKSPWQRLGERRLLPFPSSQLKGHFQGPYHARAWAKGAQGRAGVEKMGNNLSPTLKASYSAELTWPHTQQTWPWSPVCSRCSMDAAELKIKGK